MGDDRLDQLLRAEGNLTRSFWAAAVGVVGSMLWVMFVTGGQEDAGSGLGQVSGVLVVLQLAFYIWFAISAGAAARVLGDKGWKYVVWILVAPFLAQIPIPIVSTIIGVSPLSIKFLLGGQLQEAIRKESFAGFHQPI